MTKNEKELKEQEQKGHLIGAVSTIVAHSALFFLFFNATIVKTDTPKEQAQILIEFEQELEVKPIQVKAGNEPRALNPNPEKDIRLIQKSQAQEVGKKPSKGKESTMGNVGDIEKYEPPRKKPIDTRALFSSDNNKKDTLAAQTAERISNSLKAGHPEGNTNHGDIDGTPSAKLKGRSVDGALPYPTYTVNKAGKVVVKILVDQYGKVTNAIPGVQGTTVQDKTLWEAARKAALEAKFNVSSKAEIIQEGTITYIFKLK